MRKLKIYVYGAGMEYKKLYPKLTAWKERIEVLGIVTTQDIGVDNVNGYPVIRPEEICQDVMDYVVIAVKAWKEVMDTLLSNRILKEKIIKGQEIYDLADLEELGNWLEKRSPFKDGKIEQPMKKIWVDDYWSSYNVYHNPLIEMLKQHFNLEFNSIEPDYVICSVFGKNALTYDAVRIVVVGENFTPDFQHYDYAVGFEHIQIEDRYLHWAGKDKYANPYGECYRINGEIMYDLAMSKHERVDIKEFMNRGFCCRVVSNDLCSVREEFFERLNEKCYVASGGRTKNNLQPPEPVKDKHKFLEKYKFNIAIENGVSPGYTTEKIYQAWAAGCIPIYWGNPEIAKEYNEEAFVNCHNFSSIDEAVKYVLELSQDEDRMEKMLLASVKKNSSIQEQEQETLETFFVRIMSQPKDKAYRRRSYFACFDGAENGMMKHHSVDECMALMKV